MQPLNPALPVPKSQCKKCPSMMPKLINKQTDNEERKTNGLPPLKIIRADHQRSNEKETATFMQLHQGGYLHYRREAHGIKPKSLLNRVIKM
jgi:hypothetical protein